MDNMFKTTNGVKVDPVKYVKDYLAEHDDIHIFVGCDSQNYGKTTVYATVIVLYASGKGGHIIYEKERCPREQVRAIHLMNEVWKAVNLANDLCEAGVPKPDYIDIDINPNQKYKSNEVFNAAVGIVEGYGYRCRYKSLGQIATWCADAIVRK